MLIFIIDSGDRDRLEEAVNELMDIMDHEKLNQVPILVFANKQDVKGALKIEEIQKHFEGGKFDSRTWHLQPCSGYTGDGVKDGMDWLCKIFKEQ